MTVTVFLTVLKKHTVKKKKQLSKLRGFVKSRSEHLLRFLTGPLIRKLVRLRVYITNVMTLFTSFSFKTLRTSVSKFTMTFSRFNISLLRWLLTATVIKEKTTRQKVVLRGILVARILRRYFTVQGV